MNKLEGHAYLLARTLVDNYWAPMSEYERIGALNHLACGFAQTIRTVDNILVVECGTAPLQDSFAVEYPQGHMT